MEDAATAEISRSQVWQWIRRDTGALTDGRKVTVDLVRQLTGAELEKIKATVGDRRYSSGHYGRATDLFDRLVTAETFEEFLTLPGYQYLD
jgi:malate synthase